MPSEANYDLKKIIKITDLIGRDLGKHWQSGGLAYCCSGFDITFEQELNFIADNEGNIRPRG